MSLEGDLKKATSDWKSPLLVRTYDDNSKGQKRLQEEAAVLTAHGYEPQMQTQDGGHIHAGRLILTGGFSVLAGKRGIRAGGKVSITYRKQSAASVASAAGFEQHGECVVFWSGVPGLGADKRVVVGLSDAEFALLEEGGLPKFRVRLAEIGVVVDADVGVRIWRGEENVVVLRPADGRSPNVLADAINHRKASHDGTPANEPLTASAVPPQQDIPDQLRKLAELRDAGILTSEEFESKKADLLARM